MTKRFYIHQKDIQIYSTVYKNRYLLRKIKSYSDF